MTPRKKIIHPREPTEPRRPAGMQAIDAKLWAHIQQAIRVLECSR